MVLKSGNAINSAIVSISIRVWRGQAAILSQILAVVDSRDTVVLVTRREQHTRSPYSKIFFYNMPFYLAIPRPATFSGATQSGSLVKSAYIRTSPSNIMYDMASGYLYPLKTILYKSLASVAIALDKAAETSIGEQPFKRVPFYLSPYKLSSCSQIALPGVEVSLTGRPDQAVVDTIMSAGGEARRIKGQVKDIYHVIPKNYDALADLMSIEQASTDYRPTEGNISVIQIPTLAMLITRIHYVANILFSLSPFGNIGVSLNMNGNTGTTEVVSMSSEEGQIQVDHKFHRAQSDDLAFNRNLPPLDSRL